jgi:hypothetical protein
MIRTTITKKEFEKLTWMAFENIAMDINDISVELISNDTVMISVLGYEIKSLSVSDYKSIIK